MTSTPRFLTYDEYQQKLKNLKTIKDVNAFMKDLISPVLQQMLEAEMSEHLGYDKYDRPAEKREEPNARNGHSVKTIKSSFGQGEVQIPRDRRDHPVTETRTATGVTMSARAQIVRRRTKVIGGVEARIDTKENQFAPGGSEIGQLVAKAKAARPGPDAIAWEIAV
jgi:hypothetical protein